MKPILQLIYTSCPRGIFQNNSGYQFYSASDGITEPELKEVEGFVGFNKTGTCPKSAFRFFQLKSSGKYGICQTVPVDGEYVRGGSQGRSGNYFAHVLVFEEQLPCYPVQLWGSDIFRTGLQKEEVEINSKEDIAPLPALHFSETLINPRLKDLNLIAANIPDLGYLSSMIDGLLNNQPGCPVVILDKEDMVTYWFAALQMSLPKNIGYQIFFDSYLYNPSFQKEKKNIPPLCATISTKQGGTFASSEKKITDSFNVFDFHQKVFTQKNLTTDSYSIGERICNYHRNNNIETLSFIFNSVSEPMDLNDLLDLSDILQLSVDEISEERFCSILDFAAKHFPLAFFSRFVNHNLEQITERQSDTKMKKIGLISSFLLKEARTEAEIKDGALSFFSKYMGMLLSENSEYALDFLRGQMQYLYHSDINKIVQTNYNESNTLLFFKLILEIYPNGIPDNTVDYLSDIIADICEKQSPKLEIILKQHLSKNHEQISIIIIKSHYKTSKIADNFLLGTLAKILTEADHETARKIHKILVSNDINFSKALLPMEDRLIKGDVKKSFWFLYETFFKFSTEINDPDFNEWFEICLKRLFAVEIKSEDILDLIIKCSDLMNDQLLQKFIDYYEGKLSISEPPNPEKIKEIKKIVALIKNRKILYPKTNALRLAIGAMENDTKSFRIFLSNEFEQHHNYLKFLQWSMPYFLRLSVYFRHEEKKRFFAELLLFFCHCNIEKQDVFAIFTESLTRLEKNDYQTVFIGILEYYFCLPGNDIWFLSLRAAIKALLKNSNHKKIRTILKKAALLRDENNLRKWHDLCPPPKSSFLLNFSAKKIILPGLILTMTLMLFGRLLFLYKDRKPEIFSYRKLAQSSESNFGIQNTLPDNTCTKFTNTNFQNYCLANYHHNKKEFHRALTFYDKISADFHCSECVLNDMASLFYLQGETDAAKKKWAEARNTSERRYNSAIWATAEKELIYRTINENISKSMSLRKIEPNLLYEYCFAYESQSEKNID